MKKILLNERIYSKILFETKFTLLEKKVQMEPLFKQVLLKLKSERNAIAGILYNHIVNTDFDEDFPIDSIDTGSSGKSLSYAVDGQQREAKISKLLRQLRFDTRLLKKHEQHWVEFTKRLASDKFELGKEAFNFEFEIRNGVGIAEAYKCENYDYENEHFIPEKGGLDTSCLNDSEGGKSGSIDFFVINPEYVYILLMLDKDTGNIMGRALIWRTNKGFYMDRVYTINPTLKKFFYNVATGQNFWGYYKKHEKKARAMADELFAGYDFDFTDSMPALDTFKFKSRGFDYDGAIQKSIEAEEEFLMIEDMELKEFPEIISKNTNVKSIMADDNSISEIPSWIVKLKDLQILSLSDNNIEKIPDYIGKLKKLKSIDFSSNSIMELPSSIGSLQNLMSIRIKNNGIDSLPRTILNLNNLKTLDLSGNPIDKDNEIIKMLNKKGVKISL